MKVCIVVGQFPKLSETFVLDQALGLMERGHSVTVLCRLKSTDPWPDATPADVLIAGSRMWWGKFAFLRGLTSRLPFVVQDKVSAGLDWLDGRYLAQFDAIIAHFGYEGFRVARLKKRTRDLPPLITIFHGHDVGAVNARGNIGVLYSDLFRIGDVQLPVNDHFRRILIENGAKADCTRVHHMGIKVDQLPFAERDWRKRPLSILSVARLTEKKGIGTALLALSHLRLHRPDLAWSYKIIGDGELRADLERSCRELGLLDCVSFLGSRPHTEVHRLLAQSQIFLLPSITAANGDVEGIPVSLMEAMASGAVTVSTFHSGIPELIDDGVSGLLAPENEPETLAHKLLHVVDNWREMPTMARNARAKVEMDFNAAIQMDRLEVELKTLAK